MSQQYVRTFLVVGNLRDTLTTAWRRSSEFRGEPVLVTTQGGKEIEVTSKKKLEEYHDAHIPSIPALRRNANA